MGGAARGASLAEQLYVVAGVEDSTEECGPVTGGLSNGDASEDSSTPESSTVDVEEGEVGDNRSGV